jgi:hypothetical protein
MLNNAFAHGEIFKDSDLFSQQSQDIDDALELIFDSLEFLINDYQKNDFTKEILFLALKNKIITKIQFLNLLNLLNISYER